jgi:hypothetical protein
MRLNFEYCRDFFRTLTTGKVDGYPLGNAWMVG